MWSGSDKPACASVPWDDLSVKRKKFGVCASCPLFDACAEYADELEGNDPIEYMTDVWAAETVQERYYRRRDLPYSSDECANGHTFTVQNTEIDDDDVLYCLTCREEAKTWTGDRCKHGHPYTETNSYWSPSGTKRVCRTCDMERRARNDYRRRHGLPTESRVAATHCRNGHEYTEENTYYNKANGGRVCRTCRREYVRERNAAKAKGAKRKQGTATHCANGHEYTPETVKVSATGARRCQTCVMKRRKDACPQGHKYTEENTYVVPSSGLRKCRTCYRERNPLSQACKHGHPWMDDNERYDSIGRRYCGWCRSGKTAGQGSITIEIT